MTNWFPRLTNIRVDKPLTIQWLISAQSVSMLFDKTKHFWTKVTKMTKLTIFLLSLLQCRSRVFSIKSLLTEQSQCHTGDPAIPPPPPQPPHYHVITATWLINITNSPRHQVNFCKIPPPPPTPTPRVGLQVAYTNASQFLRLPPPPPPTFPASPPLLIRSTRYLRHAVNRAVVFGCAAVQTTVHGGEWNRHAGTTRREQRGNRQ